MEGFDPSWKYTDGHARSGRMIYVNGEDDYQSVFNKLNIYSRHSTFIFNTFVMFQVFNFLNARKIYDEVHLY